MGDRVIPDAPNNAATRQIRICYEPERKAELRAALEGVIAAQTGQAARLLWQEHDLRSLPQELAEKWFTVFLETDRKQRLGSSGALGMRCSSIQFDNRAELIWSFSSSLMPNGDAENALREVARAYGGSSTITEIFASSSGTAADSAAAPVQNVGSGSDSRTAQRQSPEPAVRQIEEELQQIWEIVIGRAGIRRDEDFFEAGGHSLSAARLLAHIETRMGVEVPLAALLESPTIAHQALLISAAQAARSQRAGEPQNAETPVEIPFFYLGGDATFRPLIKRLSALRRVHSLGLQTSSLARLGPRPTLQAIARDFVAEIVRREPVGSFVLGGWCAHGLLALEVAQQLKEQGRETAQLVLLEVSNPTALKVYSPWRRFVSRQQLKLHLLGFERIYVSQLNRQSAREYVWARVARKMKRLQRLFGAVNGNGHDQSLEVLYRAAEAYTPGPYDGRVLLVRSTERTLGFASNEQLGWGKLLLPRLEVQRVPGNHYTIYMPPNADTLAQTVHECIKRTESGQPDQSELQAAAVAFPSQKLHYSAASGMGM